MKTKAITDCPCRFTLAPIGIFALLLLVGAFVAPAPAVAAGEAGSYCIEEVPDICYANFGMTLPLPSMGATARSANKFRQVKLCLLKQKSTGSN